MAREVDGMTTVHVIPVNDLIEHDTDTDGDGCACGPKVEPVQRDDGSYGWVLVHASLDGREMAEQASP
ncbi:MAG TPA: hypothetical protein VGW74_11830 [Propionibacteriaceae bacterium]|nr:hypothetical protein [Propionibacteriaceae bacterium]